MRAIGRVLSNLRRRIGTSRDSMRSCPVCRTSCRQFRQYGMVPRPEAQCPNCGSLERHRGVLLYMKQQTDLFDGRPKSMLHIAPEHCLERVLRGLSFVEYLSADLDGDQAMVQMDITQIDYPADSFDVIYCSHVLEHIPDDTKAMRELHRVLTPTGWAILQVPIVADETFEDPSIVTPEQRQEVFGHPDHVRNYGSDYAERLKEAGFSVTVHTLTDVLGSASVQAHRLSEAKLCTSVAKGRQRVKLSCERNTRMARRRRRR